jgi:hypothetical protein
MFPAELLQLINSYRLDFERVDAQINNAIVAYTEIVDRSQNLLVEMFGKHICEFHKNNLLIGFRKIEGEAAKILNTILHDEEIDMVQTEMLSALSNEIMFTVFNVIITHPYFILP